MPFGKDLSPDRCQPAKGARNGRVTNAFRQRPVSRLGNKLGDGKLLYESPMPFGKDLSPDERKVRLHPCGSVSVTNAFRQRPVSRLRIMKINKVSFVLSPMPFGKDLSPDTGGSLLGGWDQGVTNAFRQRPVSRPLCASQCWA